MRIWSTYQIEALCNADNRLHLIKSPNPKEATLQDCITLFEIVEDIPW